MLTNPLHQVGWLASLRAHPQPAFQLVGHLLTDTGPILTMYWLDKMAQEGCRTGIPGLYTRYDVQTFSKRYRVLVEQRLAEVYPNRFLTRLAVHSCFSPPHLLLEVPPMDVHPTRRCRLAVSLSVALLHRINPPEFVAARLYEQQRHSPHAPYLP